MEGLIISLVVFILLYICVNGIFSLIGSTFRLGCGGLSLFIKIIILIGIIKLFF